MAIAQNPKLSEILTEFQATSFSQAAANAGLPTNAKMSDFIGLSYKRLFLEDLPDTFDAVGYDNAGDCEYAYLEFKTDGTWRLYTYGGSTNPVTGRWLSSGLSSSNFEIQVLYGSTITGSPQISGWSDGEKQPMTKNRTLALGVWGEGYAARNFLIAAFPVGGVAESSKWITLSARHFHFMS